MIKYSAGAGGGAGGHVVLQGLNVYVSGRAFANGGGGGNGQSQQDTVGTSGGDGRRAIAASIVPPTSAAEGAGGAGGFDQVLPDVGKKRNVATANAYPNAGGGGRSAGQFGVYVPSSAVPAVTPIEASPAFRPTNAIGTR